MKKTIFSFICLFIFAFNVHATSVIDSLKVEVNIDDSGVATVKEMYHINKRKANSFDRNFVNLKGVEIKNLKITNSSGLKFEQSGSFSEGTEGIYYVHNSGNSRLLRVSTDYQEDTYTVSYEVTGMIKEFTNATGFDWTFNVEDYEETIQNYNISICNSKFNKDTVDMNVIGNNTYSNIENNCMIITASDLFETTDMQVVAKFNNIDFEKKAKRNSTYELYLSKADGTYTIMPYVTKVASIVGIIIVTICLIIIALVIAYFTISRIMLNNLFGGIIGKRGNAVKKTQYEKIPCDGDLYKMSVLLNYYDKKNSPTELMIAIVTKWIFEGNAKIVKDDKGNVKIILRENDFFVNDLDKKLYKILLKASGDYELEKKELDGYLHSNYELLVNWYREAIKASLRDEYLEGNVEVKKVVFEKYIMNEKTYQKYVDLKSLKDILKNYNKISKTIDDEELKHLMLTSILLDEDVNLSTDMLKHNPNDKYAKVLSQANDLRNIFKLSFVKSKANYNFRKIKRTINYNPTK